MLLTHAQRNIRFIKIPTVIKCSTDKLSDHVEKIVASSVIMLVTKSLPHLGRSFSWLDRGKARRAEFPSQAAAPGPEPGTAT